MSCTILRGLFLAAASSALLFPPAQASPPVAPVRPVTEDFFGTKVTDPYRYMENVADPVVQDWMRSQSAHARADPVAGAGRLALGCGHRTGGRRRLTGRGAGWSGASLPAAQPRCGLAVALAQPGLAHELGPVQRQHNAITALCVCRGHTTRSVDQQTSADFC